MKMAVLPLLLLPLLIGVVDASFNVISLNTTVTLLNNTGAHVTEVLLVYMNGPSVSQYTQYRQAINLTLSNWQQALGTNLLVQHILNPKSGVSQFTFLPGPVTAIGTNGEADLIMNYNVSNVTTVKQIAPREFEYTFNDNVLNFMHSASGESLPANASLNIIVPRGARIVSIYPSPDHPSVKTNGSYGNATMFTWDSGEPLATFTFSYITTESLQQEVLSYFSSVYKHYSTLLYILAIAIIALIAVYIYVRVVRAKV